MSGIIEWAFGKRQTPAERLRKVVFLGRFPSRFAPAILTCVPQHQRALEKAQRELDRERIKLEQQEKKLIADIKRSAKNGQMGACKIQAKDLVRTRRHVPLTTLYLGVVLSNFLQICPKVLPDEDAASGRILAYPDCSF